MFEFLRRTTRRSTTATKKRRTTTATKKRRPAARRVTATGTGTANSYAKVKHGTAARTTGGLSAGDIGESKWSGKYVSKARQAHGRRMYKLNGLAAYRAPAFR